ncbi:iron-containing alcohol dehydrogenase [Streptomyces sp. NA04227]|uniref:daptide-type RiPP biosynthesis dehydogenase n=1 Tax=Streptomyces sp. NA04227 TaxID=2742136 RepID=UPI00159059AF|nr:daptide-type RiPP biosynthesis dehydogenase [Streptomyces sp. NA04227]QKW08016.1 iron-containing alcohol dehydrogenase [Streptomyces sp. NA04227]
MNLSWHCPTRALYGTAGLGDWIRGQGARTVALLADPNVAEGELASRLGQLLEGTGCEVRFLTAEGPGGLDELAALARDLDGADLLVAIGGGALLDRAKLAALLRDDPSAYTRLAMSHRSGLVMLPSDVVRRLPLVAVPTTLGTGAELSAAACLLEPADRRRLVVGEALQAELAVIDPAATSTLPYALVAEGVVEALFRVTGLYVGDHRELPTEDALAEALARRLVQLGNEVRDAGREPQGLAARGELRAEIAKVSGLTHLTWTSLGRNRYGAKGWYLANELSTALGTRKTTAVSALLPPLWRAITAGDTRLGSAPRLHRLWDLLRTAHGSAPDLPADPSDGIAALFDDWRVERELRADEEQLTRIATRTVRAWGGGLPMLGGLSAAEIRQLLAAATARAVPPEATDRPAAGPTAEPAAEAAAGPAAGPGALATAAG